MRQIFWTADERSNVSYIYIHLQKILLQQRIKALQIQLTSLNITFGNNTRIQKQRHLASEGKYRIYSYPIDFSEVDLL